MLDPKEFVWGEIAKKVLETNLASFVKLLDTLVAFINMIYIKIQFKIQKTLEKLIYLVAGGCEFTSTGRFKKSAI